MAQQGGAYSEILFIERDQYKADHHNTATLFQKGEINEASFKGGSAMRAFDINTGNVRTIIESAEGIVRDPELSYDGTKIIFSMRNNINDHYHIYEIGVDGKNLKQLTFAEGISDIDPIYLPDGNIIFSSSREPKFCMCNRHIMCNLYKMEADGANIHQLGKSTLFEGHAVVMNDGRIMYDRWEYVDRNFGDAQGLWTVNPDGTKHAIYYGNNTASPGGVIDARPIPGSDLVVAIFGSCHDRPWGALTLLDRKRGIDGEAAVEQIWPASARELIDVGDFDHFMKCPLLYEDPYPINENEFLVSRSMTEVSGRAKDPQMAIYLATRSADDKLLFKGTKSLFDPMPIRPRKKEPIIPTSRSYDERKGVYYVQDVYNGTHMSDVEKGSVKYLRIVESPEKRTWVPAWWQGQGSHSPAMNWSSFELKRILGEVDVDADGSAMFEIPSGKHVYFQLLDKDKKMIHSMRSGITVHSGEIYGCIGCHDDRLNVPKVTYRPTALSAKPQPIRPFQNRPAENFSYAKRVQPILDKHCVSCHDFGGAKPTLAGDKNPFFNASYIEMYVDSVVNLVGAGPANHMNTRSWGTKASVLTKIIDNNHQGVSLSDEEKEIIYTWMDINGPYYPTYESAYPNGLAGRSPFTDKERARLLELTGVDIYALNTYTRKEGVMISLDRPELSPILDSVKDDKAKYDEALAILAAAGEQLNKTSRGDIEEGFVPCAWHIEALKKYDTRLEIERANVNAINSNVKIYDRP